MSYLDYIFFSSEINEIIYWWLSLSTTEEDIEVERREQVILTNMCMIYDGTKVLVEEKVGKGADGIIFPGGHVEENEAIVDSVIREMKEETGLTIEKPKLCGVKEWLNEDGSRYVVFLFKTDRFSGELSSSSEGKVFWMERSEVLKANWIWQMDELLKIMADGEYTELYLDHEKNWSPVLK
ncbi:MAG: NUDIX domain-containing protein [Clostridiales bacterium]|nr:NUDIX domain-containing protein [Clostridiales bacterium]